MNLICFSWPSVHSFPCSWFSLISIFFFNDFTYLSKLGALRYQLLGLAVKDQVAYQGQHSFHQLDVHCASFIFSQHNKLGGKGLVCLPGFIWPSDDGGFSGGHQMGGRQADAKNKKQKTRHTNCPGVRRDLSSPCHGASTGRFEAAGAAWPNQTLSRPFLGKPPASARRGQQPLWAALLSPALDSVWSLTLSCCQRHPTVLRACVRKYIPKGTGQ